MIAYLKGSFVDQLLRLHKMLDFDFIYVTESQFNDIRDELTEDIKDQSSEHIALTYGFTVYKENELYSVDIDDPLQIRFH